MKGSTKTSSDVVIHFDSFGVEQIAKEINKPIDNRKITKNICIIQAYDSVMHEYFCIGFTDFTLKGEGLTNFANLLSPNTFKDNDKVILKYIKIEEPPNIHPNLSDQTQFRLKKINEIKVYFFAEICEREAMSNRTSKYIAAFDYIDKALFAFVCSKWWGVCFGMIASFAPVIGLLLNNIESTISKALIDG